MKKNNYCFIKEGLQNEIDQFKKTGDINKYFNYIKYLNLKDSINKQHCLDMISKSLTIEQVSDLSIFKEDPKLLIETLKERREEYYSQNKNHKKDLQKFINFFSAIDIDDMDYETTSKIFSEGFSKIKMEDFERTSLI